MRAVIQRVSAASVFVDQKTVGAIEKGLLVFLGIEDEDTTEDIEWLAIKLASLRIFSDESGKMNFSVNDIEQGSVLVVSQFTLHAKTKKGNRPSFTRAAHPDIAIPIYNKFIQFLKTKTPRVETGEFGADMDVQLVNNGPVTITIDTKNKE